MTSTNERINIFNNVSSKLACSSNTELSQMLATGKLAHTGIGGTSVQIEIDGTPVFVKKIPITELELTSSNYMSTSNIFKLPLCYQYGIGSTGFSAWRELAAHIMTTNWVITHKCIHFPIMYHWRILNDNHKKIMSNDEKIRLDKDNAYWENNPEIYQRLKARILATTHVCIFLEFIPYNLYQWLNKKINDNDQEAVEAIKLIELQMQNTNNFMGSENFLHMDAHFENIMTDGDNIYYSDFGLALSNKFQLSKEENDFMQDNKLYDYASGSTNLLHTVLTGYLGKENWDAILSRFAEFNFDKKIPTGIHKLLSKYCDLALAMDKFYSSIQKDKSYPFPSKDIMQLLHTNKREKS